MIHWLTSPHDVTLFGFMWIIAFLLIVHQVGGWLDRWWENR